MFKRFKPKSEFARNVLTLMTGSIIAQAIPIAIMPILTRIYSPEDFGLFVLYMSVASIFTVLATGRYELAIMLPKSEKEAANIVVLSVIITGFVTVLSALLIWFFNSNITRALGNEEISFWLYFIPLSVFLTGVYQVCTFWYNRVGKYKRLATSKVILGGGTASTSLTMGLLGFSSSGFFIADLVGKMLSTFILYRMFVKDTRMLLASVKKLKLIAVMRKYKKLPIFNSLNMLVDHFRVSGVNILISNYFTVAILGQFSLAWRMVQIPMSLIGVGLSQVFFQELAMAPKNKLHSLVKTFIIKSSLLSFPVFLVIYFLSVDVFSLFFGEEWKIAGELASIMTPWLFLSFISAPLTNLFVVIDKQEILMFISIFYMLIPLAIIFLFHHLGVHHVLQLVVFGVSFVLGGMIVYVLFATKRYL